MKFDALQASFFILFVIKTELTKIDKNGTAGKFFIVYLKFLLQK